jgi:hypothetical protein
MPTTLWEGDVWLTTSTVFGEMCREFLRLTATTRADQEAQVPKATVGKRPELIDDFIRNFLLKMKMFKTLDTFQTEWCNPLPHYPNLSLSLSLSLTHTHICTLSPSHTCTRSILLSLSL